MRALLREQHLDIAELPLQLTTSGWDNLMFRLGEELAVRVPRRALGAQLIEHEQRWLPEHARRLPLPVPAPVRLGEPGCGYPWKWSVTPWLEGEALDLGEPGPDQGPVLGGFLRALHAPPPPDAPHNPFRGGPLAELPERIMDRLARAAAKSPLLTPKVLALWNGALETPIDVAPTWLHGDLHARNVLTKDARLSAIIDWGDTCAGDPATDLAAIWTLLPDLAARQAALAAYGPLSEATMVRAKGWAVLVGAMLVDIGLADDPRMGVMGERALRRVVEGP